MEAIYFLIPLTIVLLLVAVAVFFWAVRSGQFDDLESPAFRILMDDEKAPPNGTQDDAGATDSGPGPGTQDPGRS